MGDINIDDLLDDLHEATAPTPQKPQFAAPSSSSRHQPHLPHLPHPPQLPNPGQNPKSRFVRADGTSSQKTSPTYKSSGAAAAPSSRAATEAEQNLDDWLDSLALTSPSQKPGASASAGAALGAANSAATAGGLSSSSHNASSSALWSSPSPTGKGSTSALAPSFSPEAARSSQSRYQQFGLATTLAAAATPAELSSSAASATSAASAASGGTPKAARKSSGADLDNSWDEDDFAATRSRATAPGGGGGGGGGFSLASLSNTSFPAPKAASAGASAKARCSQVVLGAARCSRGLRASAFSPCVCDALLCSQCNFKVLSFADRRWQAAADYLFLRNNMPNRDKLATRLDAAPGTVAYCCQCRSAAVSPDEDTRVLVIGAAQDPQWICTGHAS
eukprot:gene10970-7807_t